MIDPTRRPARRRSGSLLFCVLACLASVAALVGLLARDATAMRREAKLRFQRMQTERLLDAGILRAAIRLRDDPDYAGETWQPELTPTPGAADFRAANVSIDISSGLASVTAKLGGAPHITTQSYVFPTSEIK